MDEQELIIRLQEGDPGVIDDIVNQYKGPLFAFILRMVGDETTAEDIFQETWIKVMRYIRNFRGDSRLSTWLFQIALNLSRDAARKNKRWFFLPIEDHMETLVTNPGVDPYKLLQAQQVKKMIDNLPVKMREVVVLRYYHDMSDNEIAEIAGCPVGTVKSRFYRASEILRKKWENLNK